MYRLIILFLLFVSNTSIASDKSATLWTDEDEPTSKITTVNRYRTRSAIKLPLLPDSYRLLHLDEHKMIKVLDSTTNKNQKIQARSAQKLRTIELPLPDGQQIQLRFSKTTILPAKLAIKYPSIKTFKVESQYNSGIYGAIDLTEQGFHAMLFMQNGERLFIDPRSNKKQKYYISYFSKNYHPTEKNTFKCNNKKHHHKHSLASTNQSKTAKRNGSDLKTYRLAMAATGEYTAFHGGTVATALSAITTTVNRVNVVYQRDLAIKLELIANNDLLIHTDTTTYSNNNADEMLDQNQTQIDQIIESPNYDIGHVLSTFGGGKATLGSVCSNSEKAQGTTGSSQPIGDPFDIDFVSHEIGHQFAARHTFNSQLDSCANDNRIAAMAYEPGSGSTIMGYANTCSTDDLQDHSDAMFHIESITEISNFIDDETQGGSQCGSSSSNNNHPPSITLSDDYLNGVLHIPVKTPFELTGNATDIDNDVLSYSWEQVDAGAASNVNIDTGDNAIFRVFLPKSSPSRTFPQLSHLLGTPEIGEVLPENARNLHFKLAVRDGKGSVVSSEKIELSLVGTQAFKITSHSTTETLTAGASTEVKWDVANTNIAPINCNMVNILLTVDNGNSFINILNGTANDGSEFINLPITLESSTQARFKVACSNNIFFSLSAVNLNIAAIYEYGTPILSNAGSNQIADPGETIELFVPIENKSSTAITDVTANLTSTMQGVNIFSANSAYANIQPSSFANNNQAYQINIPANTSCTSDLPLSLSASFVQGVQINPDYQFSIPLGIASIINSTAVAIPDADLTGITSQVTLTGFGVVPHPEINVDLDIAHPFRGDLEIKLTSPQGTIVTLKQAETSDNTDDFKGNIPTDFIPITPLTHFDGENIDGVWTLSLIDHYFGDIGTLNHWTLHAKSTACDGNNNTVPVAINHSIATSSAINSALLASDADNNPLSYHLLSNSSKGIVSINSVTGEFSYTPSIGQTGEDSFTFNVNDGTDNSNTAIVIITISNMDSDGDGHLDVDDIFPNNPAEWLDTDADGIGNNADLDDDNDGLDDSIEITLNLNPLVTDSNGNGISDANEDSDGDGYKNITEVQAGSNPANSTSTPEDTSNPANIIPIIMELLLVLHQHRFDEYSES